MNWEKLKEAIEIFMVSFILTVIAFTAMGLFITKAGMEGINIFCIILIPIMIAYVIYRIYKDL